MEAQFLSKYGSWLDVKNSARNTINKESSNKEPSSLWKKRLLLAEHSPIRMLSINILLKGLKSWISTHLVRHSIGITHFVSTQRSDRTGIYRDNLPQSSLVNHEFVANAQAFINISRKRLCNCAAPETKEAWKKALETIKDVEPELYSVCVPDCIYRGYCYEFNSCGYFRTEDFKKKLEKYRENINTISKE